MVKLLKVTTAAAFAFALMFGTASAQSATKTATKANPACCAGKGASCCKTGNSAATCSPKACKGSDHASVKNTERPANATAVSNRASARAMREEASKEMRPAAPVAESRD